VLLRRYFDPFDKNHLIVSYIDIGLFHSYDGGKSWKQLVTGIPNDWVNTCYHVTFDPTVKGRVWSTWANQHSLPRKSQFGDGKFEGHSGGVAYSIDGGKTWQKYSNGLPENCIATDLLLDPSSPENSRTLYLSTFNQGVYKSTDGGKSWVSASNGLKDNRYAWEIRMAGKRIYLLCVRGYRGETSIDGKLYYSDDNAGTWKESVLPVGVTGPSDILVDPKNPEHIYLVAGRNMKMALMSVVECMKRIMEGKAGSSVLIKESVYLRQLSIQIITLLFTSLPFKMRLSEYG